MKIVLYTFIIPIYPIYPNNLRCEESLFLNILVFLIANAMLKSEIGCICCL